MSNIQTVIKNNIRQYAMLLALALIMVLFQILTNGILLVPQNVTNLLLQNSYVIILAVGMVLCIISSGNIDLSVGSVCGFIGAVLGVLIIQMKLPIPISIVIALFIGALIGAWHGFWIAYIRIPAFIVTLAGMLLFRGLTLYILKGQTLSPFPSSFLFISSGYIEGILGKAGNADIFTFVIGVITAAIYILSEIKNRFAKKKKGLSDISFIYFIIKIAAISFIICLFAYWLALFKGIPFILVIMLVLIIGYTFFTLKTIPGRYIYAMGGNEKAAKLSGINTNKVLFSVYVNMSVLAALAGIAFTARLQAAPPSAGQNFELDAIAACFIGGASAYGGVGTVTGAVIGAFVMGVLNNGMSILGIGSDLQMAIKGLVLLAAVAFDVISKNKGKL